MPSAVALTVDSALIYPAIISSGISGALVLTKNLHGKFTLDSHEGVQKFHVAPTPRIGGIALFGALVVAWLLGNATGGLLGLMLIAGLPAFLAGILEDLTKKVGVRERLLATMFSGLLACFVTGYHLKYVELPWVDDLFALTPFALAFTAFAVGGVANAINIIDGFNGLAGGVLMICFGMFGLIAWQVGDMQLVNLCLLLAISVAGFMLLNFPFGKIFMGDGGAYFMGFLLAWIGVLLPMRNTGVSPWASIVVCGYPIIETLFSMWRKIYRKGYHPGQPDRVHFHMLMYQRFSRALFFGQKTSLINGLTTLFIMPFALLCSTLGLVFYSSALQLKLSLLCCFAVYYLIYLRLTQFHWCLKPNKLTGAIRTLPLAD